MFPCMASCNASSKAAAAVEEKRKDYAFRRQFSQKFIPGCPGAAVDVTDFRGSHVPAASD